MEYDLKTSKQIITDLCTSLEFNEFKDALKQLNLSIDDNNVEMVVDSIIAIGRTRDLMLSRVNSAFKYKIEKHLTKSQIGEVDMEAGEEGVSIVYKHYVPSYIKEGIYTSVDATLLKVDFKNRKIFMPDIGKEFEEAQKHNKAERIKEKTRLEVQKYKIDEMKMNRDSKIYVVNAVKSYNKSAIKNNAFEKIKCLVSKNISEEYLDKYDEILAELIEEYKIREEDFNRTKEFSYVDKSVEVSDIQKGLVRRLVPGLQFTIQYENLTQKVNTTKNPMNILKLYSN